MDPSSSLNIFKRPSSLNLIHLLLLFLLIIVTNRVYPWEIAIHEMNQTDIASYRTLAKNPFLEWRDIHFLHAQRFFFPSVIGFTSRKTGVGLEQTFLAASVFFLLLIPLLVFQDLQKLGISESTKTICMFLLLFNPYLARFYLAYPGRLVDAIFILGTALVFSGLFQGKIKRVLGGIAVAAAARQTSLLLLPTVILWIGLSQRWKECSKTEKIFLSFCASAVIFSIYASTAFLAGGEPWGLRNAVSIAGMASWIRDEFNLRVLLEFLARGLFPFLFTLSIVVGALLKKGKVERLPVEFFLCLFCFLLICIQPLLAGPVVAEHNIGRLNMLGFIPFIMGVAILLDHSAFGQNQFNRYHGVIILCILLGSLHHQTSILAAFRWSNIQFSFWNISCGLAALIASYLSCPLTTVLTRKPGEK